MRKRYWLVSICAGLMSASLGLAAPEDGDPELAAFIEALRAGVQAAKSTGGDPNDQADRLRYVLQQAFEGYRIYFETDPDFPEWVEGSYYPRGNGGNSPDTTYFYTRIDPAGTYRIWGKRHTIAFSVLQVGTMGDVLLVGGKPLGHYFLDDLTLAGDGSFELILSNQRPQGYRGDWRPLDSRAEIIYLRQIMLNWGREQDAEVYIERLDRPAVPPRRTAEDLRSRWRAMSEYTRKATTSSQEPSVPIPPINDLVSTAFSETGGLSSQMYQWGRFDLSETEALVVEGPAPSSCRFWNFEVTDVTNSANDYMYRQTHLNKSMLSVDRDGKFRLVVSLKDPGVANWIDTAGHGKGIMLTRWESCKVSALAEVKKINLSTLKDHLPADTRWVTGAERSESLRSRSTVLRKRLHR
jgi:hypothetical protein